MTISWTEEFSKQERLIQAWQMVKSSGGGPGGDGMGIDQFQIEFEKRLDQLHRQIKKNSFKFSRLRPAIIPKDDGGQRKLLIPTVTDRIVLQSIRLAIEPFFEQKFLPCSHAYRPGRGAFTAMQQVATALKNGFRYVLESDIQTFYDSIRHSELLKSINAVNRNLAENCYLNASLKLSSGWWPAKKGISQGSPLSPLLANISLIEFDEKMTKSQCHFVRYADDFIVLCKTESDCRASLQSAAAQLKRMGLELHPGKTRIVDSHSTSFSFLGFEIMPDRVVPSQQNLAELRSGVTSWCNPHLPMNWSQRIDRINGLLRSFAWYYHQTDSRRLFWSLDQFVLEQLEHLEKLKGPADEDWRSRLIQISEMRDVSWTGKSKGKAKSQSWNGYGR